MAYLVASLVNLRSEIDILWPGRDRRTDGWYRNPTVGRSVGHNPDGKGAVHAIDVDVDGIWPMYIVDRVGLIKGVIWYVIWDRRLWSDDYGWKPRAYTGSNPHKDHLHIEVRQSYVAEVYDGPWGVASRTEERFGTAPETDPQWSDADPALPMAITAGHLVGGGTAGVNTATAIAGLRSL